MSDSTTTGGPATLDLGPHAGAIVNFARASARAGIRTVLEVRLGDDGEPVEVRIQLRTPPVPRELEHEVARLDPRRAAALDVRLIP